VIESPEKSATDRGPSSSPERLARLLTRLLALWVGASTAILVLRAAIGLFLDLGHPAEISFAPQAGLDSAFTEIAGLLGVIVAAPALACLPFLPARRRLPLVAGALGTCAILSPLLTIALATLFAEDVAHFVVNVLQLLAAIAFVGAAGLFVAAIRTRAQGTPFERLRELRIDLLGEDVWN
jgi:hypothetical protein